MASNNPRVRVYVKRQLRLDRLTFNQQQMFQIGTKGVESVKNRVQSARNATDSAAKPLTKKYAIRKTMKFRRKVQRDLTLSGRMIENFQVRTVSENKAYASMTTRHAREAAGKNNSLERWVAFSPTNIKQTIDAAYVIFKEIAPRLVIQRWLGK